MGLAIRVYQNIKEIPEGSHCDFVAYVIDPRWKWKIKNLTDNGYYIGDCVADSINYPYSQHSRFRESLIKLISREDLLDSDGRINWENLPNNIPFYNFIDFADNEGCLDWEVSEKIYNDFKKWQNTAGISMSGYIFEIYLQWMNAFDLARNNGVVVFT